MKLLVLDTETTGLDMTRHEIIQIGFLLMEFDGDQKFELISESEIKIRPLHLETAEPAALAVNGFTAYGWKDTKPINEHFEEIKQKIENADLMLGQNLVFDLRFIKQAYENLNAVPPAFPQYIDTKWMATQLLKEGKLKSTSMDKMCKHFNIKIEGKAHTALVDCKRTLEVYKLLAKQVADITKFTFIKYYDPFER
jgi:DNA polymerase III alpha subunit (gram-positive type)